METTIELPVSCQVDGRTWSLFTFKYETPDGTFNGYLHALSLEHAAALLFDLKQTAELVGQMVGTVK